MSDLKPCPFCGSSDLHVADTGVCWVSCNSCQAEGPVSAAPIGGGTDETGEAREAWNRRSGAAVVKAWPDGFFIMEPRTRLYECATEGCGQRTSIRVERDGVGSNYCEPCARKIAALTPAPPAGDGQVEAFCQSLYSGWHDEWSENRREIARIKVRHALEAAALSQRSVTGWRSKLPTAFLVATGDGTYHLTSDENLARCLADDNGVEYRGLYERNGDPGTYGPFAHLIIPPDMAEDEWSVEDDPATAELIAEGYQSIPLFAVGEDPMRFAPALPTPASGA